MNFKYDYFISYGCFPKTVEELLDPEFVKKYNGFVDEFVSKLENSSEFQSVFGRKARVFCYKTFPETINDWDKTIYPEMTSSRSMIIFLSPHYFRNLFCFLEFNQWMEREAHTGLMRNSVIPMFMMEYSPQNCSFEKDVSREMVQRFPSASQWADFMKTLLLNESVDMHDLQTSKIDDALNCLITISKERFEKQDKCVSNPCNKGYPQVNERFVARRDILEYIRKTFAFSSFNSDSIRPVLLYGLNGVGKTEIALKYGNEFGWDYGLGRIFVPCENKTSFSSAILSSGIAELFDWEIPAGTEDQQLAFLLQKLQQKRLHQKLKQKHNKDLSSQGGKSNDYGTNLLLILDNVNQPELLSKENMELLPDFIHVIVTSRRAPSQFSHFDFLSINGLGESNSVKLLQSYRDFSSQEDVDAAQNLCERFDGFPLALVQTGLYLQSNDQVSYSEFYDDLCKDCSGVLQKIANCFKEFVCRPAESIEKMFKAVYNDLSPNAQMFLEFTELMSPEAIPIPWIREYWETDDSQFDDTLRELIEYNILSSYEEAPHLGIINKLITQFKIRKNEKMIQDAIPWFLDRSLRVIQSSWSSTENLWELDAAVGIYNAYINAENDVQKWISNGLPDLFLQIGQIYKDLKVYNKARFVFTKNLDMCRKILDVLPADITTLKFMSNYYERLGNIEMEDPNGDLDKAINLYENELNIDEMLVHSLPDDEIVQINLATTYGRMSDLEKKNGNLEKALEWLHKALNHAQSLEGRFQPDNEHILGVLSFIYARFADIERNRDLFDIARQWYHKSREIDEGLAARFSNDYKRLNNLALIYSKLGTLELDANNAASAVEWYQKAQEIRKRIAEDMPEILFVHQQLCESYGSLAIAEMKAGDFNSAEIHYINKVTILNYLINSNPGDISDMVECGQTYMTLGDINRHKEDFQTSLKLYQDALSAFEDALQNQPDNLDALYGKYGIWNKLGDMTMQAGISNDAIQCYQNGMNVCCQILKFDCNNYFALHLNSQMLIKIGALHYSNKDYKKAKEALTFATDILRDLAQKLPANENIQEDLEMCLQFMERIDNKQSDSQSFLDNLFDRFFGK